MGWIFEAGKSLCSTAPTAQTLVQWAHPMQRMLVSTLGPEPFSVQKIVPLGQTSQQRPHPTHFWVFILIFIVSVCKSTKKFVFLHLSKL